MEKRKIDSIGLRKNDINFNYHENLQTMKRAYEKTWQRKKEAITTRRLFGYYAIMSILSMIIGGTQLWLIPFGIFTAVGLASMAIYNTAKDNKDSLIANNQTFLLRYIDFVDGIKKKDRERAKERTLKKGFISENGSILKFEPEVYENLSEYEDIKRSIQDFTKTFFTSPYGCDLLINGEVVTADRIGNYNFDNVYEYLRAGREQKDSWRNHMIKIKEIQREIKELVAGTSIDPNTIDWESIYKEGLSGSLSARLYEAIKEAAVNKLHSAYNSKMSKFIYTEAKRQEEQVVIDKKYSEARPDNNTIQYTLGGISNNK